MWSFTLFAIRNLNKLPYAGEQFFREESAKASRAFPRSIIKHKISHFINYRNNSMIKILSGGLSKEKESRCLNWLPFIGYRKPQRIRNVVCLVHAKLHQNDSEMLRIRKLSSIIYICGFLIAKSCHKSRLPKLPIEVSQPSGPAKHSGSFQFVIIQRVCSSRLNIAHYFK